MKNRFSNLLGTLAITACAAAPGFALIPGTVAFNNFFLPSSPNPSGLKFDRPIAFAQYPQKDSTYVVVEEVGRITTVEFKSGAWTKTDSARIPLAVLNDISTSSNKCTTPIVTRSSSTSITTGVYESRGLLGFAFHPNFKVNRKYYISYVTVVNNQEFSVVAERVADSAAMHPRTTDVQRNLFSTCQPYWDHKGGTINIGPDGHLYFALGDGGNQALLPNPGPQRLDTYLGKMMRFDINSTPDSGKNYKVPTDNPFVGNSAALPEIWATGLRNPWKWSFNPVSGKLWVGDVGYVSREEVSIIPKGGNMGWRLWEGDYCLYANSNVDSLRAQCAPPQAIPPVHVMVHQDAGGSARAVMGGTFRLGDTSMAFHDTYIFGDYIFGDVWALRLAGDNIVDTALIGNIGHVVSFDRDSSGNIFATSLGTGGISSNTGVVYGLTFMKPAAPPTGVRAEAPALRGKPVSWNTFRRNPANYDIIGLDGREIHGKLPAVFMVREKGSQALPSLMTTVH